MILLIHEKLFSLGISYWRIKMKDLKFYKTNTRIRLRIINFWDQREGLMRIRNSLLEFKLEIKHVENLLSSWINQLIFHCYCALHTSDTPKSSTIASSPSVKLTIFLEFLSPFLDFCSFTLLNKQLYIFNG